jgi:hypothetical protein
MFKLKDYLKAENKIINYQHNMIVKKLRTINLGKKVLKAIYDNKIST